MRGEAGTVIDILVIIILLIVLLNMLGVRLL